MSDIAIKVENISKRYQIGENKKFPTLRDKLMELPNRLFKGPKKTKEFWALKDVSFEIKKGEIVGIIGRNGAGKSTLLKILARITEPTSGQVTMYGRVASMLEVGTGFNQELTGRENIYLNGAIIGMTKKEIQTKFDDIVEFSGVGKFLDTPVKHYSSGMYVRLAFAVAAHLDADILLVDEVLAVGDDEFQKKCLGKMTDMAESGKTVIFVSHNINAINNLCTSTILMQQGVLKSIGKTHEIIKTYIHILNERSTSTNIFKRDNEDLLLQKVKVTSINNDSNFRYGENIQLIIFTNKRFKPTKYSLEIIIKNQNSENIIYSSSLIYQGKKMYNSGDTIHVLIPNINLVAGVYTIDINCRNYPSIHVDRWYDGAIFNIVEAKPLEMPNSISIEENLGSTINHKAIYSLIK